MNFLTLTDLYDHFAYIFWPPLTRADFNSPSLKASATFTAFIRTSAIGVTLQHLPPIFAALQDPPRFMTVFATQNSS